jgi:hypothetical protein
VSNHAKLITDTGAGGKTKRVSSSGTSDTKNDIMLYSFVEAEPHEAAAKSFASRIATKATRGPMSPLTLFIAKLIGLMFLVFSLLMAMNKRAMLAAIDELVRSRGLMLIAGSFNLAAGLAIMLGHNVWSGGTLTIVVTLIGWLVALRGVVWLITPQEKLVQFYEALHFERKYYVATAITGALGLYLTVAGFAG